MFNYIIRVIYEYFFGKTSIIYKIEDKLSEIIYQSIPDNVFSSYCQDKIGCKYHRCWINKSSRLKTLFSTSIGFQDMEISKDKRIRQVLCYIANHRVIHNIMKNNNWSVNVLKELVETDIVAKNNNNGLQVCYGYNMNFGTDCIAVKIKRLSDENLLSYDHIFTTIIHELVHNDISAHNDIFRKKEKELQDYFNQNVMYKVNWIK